MSYTLRKIKAIYNNTFINFTLFLGLGYTILVILRTKALPLPQKFKIYSFIWLPYCIESYLFR
ncbi:MAG: hypothetical protein EAZ08_01130 [Cytophagales bacterium]|nr:MAG: hypothetical protein EAZ08_01130 [Cytophagales bacterium]